jgi:uncharacterized membrane protein
MSVKAFNYPFYFILPAILYAIAGMGLGLYQHLSKNFAYIPLHNHVSALGWMSLAIIGLMFHSFPALARSRLAPWQFWCAHLGVLLLNGGLVLVYMDATRVPIYIGTVLTPLSYVLLLLMFARHGRSAAST